MDLVLERVVNNSAARRHKNRMDSMQESTERLSQKAFRELRRNSLDKHIIKTFGLVALLSKSWFQLHSTNKIPYMEYT